MDVVIINDCSNVGLTLSKFMEARYLKYKRNIYERTFKMFYHIYKAKADIYHVNYMLQYPFFAFLLKKRPIIAHAHGSDVRYRMNTPIIGEIIKFNLRKSNAVIVSTPDILSIVRIYNENSLYIPNPVDMNFFHPLDKRTNEESLQILIASECNWKTKGTDIAIKALKRIRENVVVSIIKRGPDFEKTIKLAKKYAIKTKVLPKGNRENIREYYWNADVVFDQFVVGSLGLISLEAISSGKPVITYVSSAYDEYNDFPIRDKNNEGEIISSLSMDLEKLWKAQFDYVKKVHDANKVTKKIRALYKAIR